MYRSPKQAAVQRIAMIGVAAMFSVLMIETITSTAHRAPAEHWTQKSVAVARATLAAKAERERLAGLACDCPLIAHAD